MTHEAHHTAEKTDASVFTEAGAFLTEPALKAFAEGMKSVKPTEALIAAMSRAKAIRRA